MSLDTLIILSGALVALLPFLGFPNSWDNALFFILGMVVIALGIVLRRRSSTKSVSTLPTPESRIAPEQNDAVHEL